MRIPPRLIPLVEDGIIDEVLGQVKSGKEADVFIVRVGDEVRCAKVYKEADQRSFRQAAVYQEGRKVQNSRSARAIAKSTRFGKKEAEASWIGAEVAALNTLSAAGIRVPKPFGFFDGVLIMELILGEDGLAAPRLNDMTLSPETALLYHEELISQIVRMLCAGIIHGDLSEFNVLVDAEGPVIIDLPQAVNAAGNNSAAMLFARDVDNMARWFGRFEPGILGLKYAKEIWALYEKRKLTPETVLTGQFVEPVRTADVSGVLDAIGDARKEHEEKLLRKSGERAPRFQDRGAEKPEPGSDHATSQGRNGEMHQGRERGGGRGGPGPDRGMAPGRHQDPQRNRQQGPKGNRQPGPSGNRQPGQAGNRQEGQPGDRRQGHVGNRPPGPSQPQPGHRPPPQGPDSPRPRERPHAAPKDVPPSPPSAAPPPSPRPPPPPSPPAKPPREWGRR
jgi:RIO kinase 1